MHLVEVIEVVLPSGVFGGPNGFLLLEGWLERFADGEVEHDFIVVILGHPDFLFSGAAAVAGVIRVADVALVARSTNEAPTLVEVRDDVLREALLPVRDIMERLHELDEFEAEAEEHGFAWFVAVGIY